MLSIDLNADLGEGGGQDAAIMPFISSVNIACGYHAGDQVSILQTIELAVQHQVAIGAHPGFADREHFGRKEFDLTPGEYYALIIDQLHLVQELAKSLKATLHHVKPHGALYNISAKDKTVASSIARAIHDFDPELIVYGLSGSHSISEAKAFGLRTASEVFADRSYQSDSSLTPRSHPHALLDSVEEALSQVLLMIEEGKVKSIDGSLVPVLAETVCIHGDGLHAAQFAKRINQTLHIKQILIQAPRSFL
jgi:UPF0271 protein